MTLAACALITIGQARASDTPCIVPIAGVLLDNDNLHKALYWSLLNTGRDGQVDVEAVLARQSGEALGAAFPFLCHVLSARGEDKLTLIVRDVHRGSPWPRGPVEFLLAWRSTARNTRWKGLYSLRTRIEPPDPQALLVTEAGHVAPLVDGLSTLGWQVRPSAGAGDVPAERYLYVADAIRAMRFPATLTLASGAPEDASRPVSSDIVRGRLGLGLAGLGSTPQIKLGVSPGDGTAAFAFVDCFHDELHVAGVQRPFGPLAGRILCPRPAAEAAEAREASVWIEAFAPPHRPLSELSSVAPRQDPGAGCEASRWLERAPSPEAGAVDAAVEWLEQAAAICREGPADERHRTAVEQVLDGLRRDGRHTSVRGLGRAAPVVAELAMRSESPPAWEGVLQRLAELAPNAVAPVQARVSLVPLECAHRWCHELGRSPGRSQQALACLSTVARLDPERAIPWPAWSSALGALPRLDLGDLETVVALAGQGPGAELLASISSCLDGAPPRPFSPAAPGAAPGTSAILVGLSDNHPMPPGARRCVLSHGASACLSELAGGHACAAPHAVGRYLRVAPAREHEAWARAAREAAAGSDAEPARSTAVRASFHAAVVARDLAEFAADQLRANRHEEALVDALRVLEAHGPSRWSPWRGVVLPPLIGTSDTPGWVCCSKLPGQAPVDESPRARPLVGGPLGPVLTVGGLVVLTAIGTPFIIDATSSAEPIHPSPGPEPEPDSPPLLRAVPDRVPMVALAASGIVVILGLVLWLSDDDDADEVSVPVTAGPDGAEVGIRIPF